MMKSPAEYLAINALNYDKAAHEGLRNNGLFQEFKANYIKSQASYRQDFKKAELEFVDELRDFKDLLEQSPEMVTKIAAARDYVKANPGQKFDNEFLRGIQLFEMIEGEIK